MIVDFIHEIIILYSRVAVFYYLDSTCKWRVLCDSGFMTMQLGSLIPSGVTSEELLVHVMNFDHPTVVEQLIIPGFDLVELSGDLGLFLPQTLEPESIERQYDLKEGMD